MTHICTRCNNVFEDGADILKGCPVCGWKKFMFTRKGQETGDDQATSKQPLINQAMGVRVPPRQPNESKKEENELTPKPEPAKPEPQTAGTTENGQGKVESIRITAPGTYELNLPSLFEREELIMAVKEGTYLIDLSSAFRKGKKE